MSDNNKKKSIPKKVSNSANTKMKVNISHLGATQHCQVNGVNIETFQDCDTGAYFCSQLPYQTFITLEELGNTLAKQLNKK